MLCIIGGYRGLYPRLLGSLLRHADGITRFAFVDDSGNPETVALLQKWGTVIPLNREGYGPAMQAVCELGAAQDSAIFMEEDFTLNRPVSFTGIRYDLNDHDDWAQIVLQRQPWFPIEVEHGGVVEACIAKGHTFEQAGGYLVHDAFFSMNPTVIRREVFATGWPQTKWSEDAKRDELKASGYRFAITRDIYCHHDGVRSGSGY